MHELSIVEALLDQVEEELERAGQKGPVRRLDLAVGRLSGVSCDALRFAFEVFSPGTIAEGAVLEISEPAASSLCRQCGASREIDGLVAACPACGSHAISIEKGRELMLRSIETAD